MLTELSIRNLAVIEYVQVRFANGFHVLTGETGAGKSMIIDALTLLVGGRGYSELVRHGADKAEIEGVFDLAADHPVWDTLHNLGIDADRDETLVIRREISSLGKSGSRINGQLVNVTMLREVGDCLVNIHGQHEHQSLLQTERHLEWLDVYDEQAIIPIRDQYAAAYNAYSSVSRELAELQDASRQHLQMMDLYSFQLEEIQSAALKFGEDESLEEEKRKLANAEKLVQAAAGSYDALYANDRALDSIGAAIKRLEDIADIDANVLNPILQQVQGAFYQLEDAAHQIRSYRDGIEFNPQRLDFIEDRLNKIAYLRKKYGPTVAEIIQLGEKLKQQIDQITNRDDIIARLSEQVEKAKEKLIGLARQLSAARRAAADRLAAEIELQLKDLHMEHTQFYVQIDSFGGEKDEQSAKFSAHGWDHAEFLISPNPGEPLRSLSRVASGGEMSRIMLALKTIFARIDQVPVLVFDEVDAGVSGRAAQSIAEKISELSRFCQVFAITHLPQVACMANEHYAIRKVLLEGRTFTQVDILDRQGRIEELARLLGGVEITETTLHHAEEMLKLAEHKVANM